MSGVFEFAAREFAPSGHGDLLWSHGGTKCYGRQDDADAVLTLVGDGEPLQYVLVGVPVDAL